MDNEIFTERLRLRPFVKKDAEEFFRITQDKDIKKYVSYAAPNSINEALEMISTCYCKCDFIHDFYFVIENKNTDEMVGALIAYECLEKRFDMSLIIAFEHRCKGYMMETINAFKEKMPTKSKLLFCVKEKNFASLSMVEKLPGICEIQNSHKLKGLRYFILEI